MEELKIASEELQAIRIVVEKERQRYQELFDFAPDGYLVTDTNGIILEANRLKDEFLAIVSHELRTPLNSMLGWVQIIRNRTLDEATTFKALATIERNAKLQSKLIEDILDISRIVQGKIRITVRKVDLVVVINAAIEAVHPTSEINGLCER